MTSWPSLWIANFLSKPENAFMCVVDEQFIRDGFNLFGLNEVVPGFPVALRIVLGMIDNVTHAHRKSSGPEMLYGLVHARFVMTDLGVERILDKYDAGCFGNCPRINCKRPAHCLPVGLYDEAGKSMVRLYCPQCTEIYFPSKMVVESLVDGAYFGTGLPEMVFMTRPECRPLAPKVEHVSTIFGFKIHSSAIEFQRYAATKKSTSTSTNTRLQITNDVVTTGRQSTITTLVDNFNRQSTSTICQQTDNILHTTDRRLTTIATPRQSTANVTTVTSIRKPNIAARRPTNVVTTRQSVTNVNSVRKPNITARRPTNVATSRQPVINVTNIRKSNVNFDK